MARYREDGARVEAERRYAAALGLRNQQAMTGSNDREFFENLSTLINNVTKGSARVADYVLVPAQTSALINARAWVAANTTIDDIINGRPVSTAITQTDVWNAFQRAEAFHDQYRQQIHTYEAHSGGYSVEQHVQEVHALGELTKQTMVLLKNRPAAQKQQVFFLFVRIFNMTSGADPLLDA